MKPLSIHRALLVLGVLAAVVSVVVAARNAAHLPREVAWCVRDYGTLLRLNALAEQAAEDRAALAALAVDAPLRPDMAAWFGERFPGVRPEGRELDVRSLVDGWRARRVEVALQAVDLHAVGGALSGALEQRPPWRLVSCRIGAEGAPGRGRATLVFEVLERAGEGSGS